jgi:hypothetical protein
LLLSLAHVPVRGQQSGQHESRPSRRATNGKPLHSTLFRSLRTQQSLAVSPIVPGLEFEPDD